MIAHIVLFTPKDTLDDASRRSFATEVVVALRGISSVRRAFIGKQVSVDAGYERSFGDETYQFAAVVEFDDRAGLVDYLNSPLHNVLGRMFWENCSASVICEVESADLDDPTALESLWRTT